MLRVEYARYRCSRNILKKFLKTMSTGTKESRYELRKILERILMGMANINPNTVYVRMSVRHKLIRQAMVELMSKPTIKSSICWLQQKVKEIVLEPTKLFLTIRTHHKLPVSPSKLTYVNNTICYHRIKLPVTERCLTYLKTFPNSTVLRMVLRYASVLPGGQHWGVGLEMYEHLYNKYGIRFEGFATPLNSRLMGRPDAYFCSMFKDTDTPFGSLGTFFKVNMINPTKRSSNNNKIAWTVNPPYIDHIMTKSARKVHKACIEADKNGIELMVFFIMPGWTDSTCYDILSKSKYKRKEVKLFKGKHKYEYQNKQIVARFNSYVFVLDTMKKTVDYSDICCKMNCG